MGTVDGRQTAVADGDVLGVIRQGAAVEGGLAAGGGDQQPVAVDEEGLTLGADGETAQEVADLGQGQAGAQDPLELAGGVVRGLGIMADQLGLPLAPGEADAEEP